VTQVFNEMGCVAETGVTKELPRGRVEFDIIVDDVTTTPHSLYVCECKHWSRRVPQYVVHGFRTTVIEIGANRGFIISRAGFQSGAREAAKWTNVDILTWEEFEGLMFDRWIDGVTRRLNPSFVHAHRLNNPNDERLWDGYEFTEEAFNRLWAIGQKHSLIDLWALFVWLHPGGLRPIVAVGTKDYSGPAPTVLDTYRKVVTAAPRICASAVEELTGFWKTVKRKPDS
jgi:hypothetical protein